MRFLATPRSILCPIVSALRACFVYVCVNIQLVPACKSGSHVGIYCRLASMSLRILTFLTSPWGSTHTLAILLWQAVW